MDGIIEDGLELFPIEIKSGETVASDFFNSLTQWNALAQNNPENCYVVYGGELVQERSVGNLLGWKAAGSLVDEIRNGAKKR